MNYEHLKLADPELYASMERELGRQRDHLELIASENFTSPAVMEADQQIRRGLSRRALLRRLRLC